jgi:NADPH:quinone reductase-like Zn-dependent oxidoreductase
MHAHRLGHQGNNGRLRWPPLAFELGANNFIDLAKDRWVDAVGQADLVVDAIGGDIPERSPAIVRPRRRLISVVTPPPTTRDDIRTLTFIREQSGPQLVEIARLVDAGDIRPRGGAVYQLAEGSEAFTAKSASGIPGRVILQP